MGIGKKDRHPLQTLPIKSRHDTIYDNLSFNVADVALLAMDAFAEGHYDKYCCATV